jgi:hypothetical protein
MECTIIIVIIAGQQLFIVNFLFKIIKKNYLFLFNLVDGVFLTLMLIKNIHQPWFVVL